MIREDAELLRVGDMAIRRCGLEQFLGRDAADMQARAADLVALGQGDVEAGGGAVQRRGVAARTAADDRDIMMSCGNAEKLVA